MSPRATEFSDRLATWYEANCLREHPAQTALRAETDALSDGGMRSSAEQMQLLAFLLRLMGARQVLEIGCFTGYGSLSMALALPAGGRLVTLDVNEHWAAIGRRHWEEAGVAERIELRLGTALESLDALLAEGAADSFDLAYVDADKKGYDGYVERALRLVRPGGVVAMDNMFWDGAVADPDNHEHQTEILRALSRKLLADPRVDLSVVPIGDGLTLARRR